MSQKDMSYATQGWLAQDGVGYDRESGTLVVFWIPSEVDFWVATKSELFLFMY